MKTWKLLILFELITLPITYSLADFEADVRRQSPQSAQQYLRGSSYVVFNPSDVRLRDVNGDGLQDLFLPNYNSYLLQKKDGSFAPADTVSSNYNFLTKFSSIQKKR